MKKLLCKLSQRNLLTTKVFLLTLLFVIFFSQNSQAQIVDSSFYRWKVYEIQEDELSPKQCYIVSHPIKSESDQVSRKKPYFMIARFQRQRNEEVSVYGGFEYKLNRSPFIIEGRGIGQIGLALDLTTLISNQKI